MSRWPCYLVIAASGILVGWLLAPLIQGGGEVRGLIILLTAPILLGTVLQMLVRLVGCPFSASCPAKD